MEVWSNTHAVGKRHVPQATLAALGDQKFHTRLREISQDLAVCILHYRANWNRKR